MEGVKTAKAEVPKYIPAPAGNFDVTSAEMASGLVLQLVSFPLWWKIRKPENRICPQN